eukprot:TRINITY_DN19354_c0_g1_i1.p1 TRINITY_DN19354_c0_g1~~TRINITY_DN19354_c0_g1_i1.p1  ORF type:complete len:256 (-),score=23.95 TRINITY_DN19354_c0_g1_i1:32-730(-)
MEIIDTLSRGIQPLWINEGDHTIIPPKQPGILTVKGSAEIPKDRLNISDLYCTQTDLRHADVLPSISRLVRDGGILNHVTVAKHLEKQTSIDTEPHLVVIAKGFEDGRRYVWDGHHRLLGIWNAGRKFLYPEEFLFMAADYKLCSSIRYDLGFVTPYDPKSEVRSSNFAAFKGKILKMALELGEDVATDEIHKSKSIYSSPRKVNTIPELHELYKSHFEKNQTSSRLQENHE